MVIKYCKKCKRELHIKGQERHIWETWKADTTLIRTHYCSKECFLKDTFTVEEVMDLIQVFWEGSLSTSEWK